VLLALREAIAAADGASLDLDALARRLDTDREVVRSALAHAIDRGWLVGAALGALPAGCGTSGCRPDASRPACRRCPLAG
jgi:hypothetical protein